MFWLEIERAALARYILAGGREWQELTEVDEVVSSSSPDDGCPLSCTDPETEEQLR